MAASVFPRSALVECFIFLAASVVFTCSCSGSAVTEEQLDHEEARKLQRLSVALSPTREKSPSLLNLEMQEMRHDSNASSLQHESSV